MAVSEPRDVVVVGAGPAGGPGGAVPRAHGRGRLPLGAGPAGLFSARGAGGAPDGVVIGVTCEDGSGPETLPARLVIGADGRRSVVARQLGLLREHRSLRKFAVRGHWEEMDGLEERGE